MQTESVIPSVLNGKAAVSVAAAEDELADFSTNRRVLLLSAMALAIGAISSLVAYALIWLIAAITNLAFYHRFSAAPAVPQGHHLGLWVVLVPVAGALIIGLMARLGSEKIRGHGIPEAIRDRIFDSFLSTRPDGTGLGLAIVERILRSHHGAITVLATSGRGTTMRVTLPLAK